MILGQAYGSAKLAVPTPMAEEPAINISIAASALSTPPIPIIGRSEARATWRISLRATGKTAGPDIPPWPLAMIGLRVAKS